MENSERKYVLMTSKHASVEHPLFWGSRTKDNEKRSFGGYTSDPNKAELYLMDDIIQKFGPSETLLGYTAKNLGTHILEYSFSDWVFKSKSDDVFITLLSEAMALK